jgi:hypothetical protein
MAFPTVAGVMVPAALLAAAVLAVTSDAASVVAWAALGQHVRDLYRGVEFVVDAKGLFFLRCMLATAYGVDPTTGVKFVDLLSEDDAVRVVGYTQSAARKRLGRRLSKDMNKLIARFAFPAVDFPRVDAAAGKYETWAGAVWRFTDATCSATEKVAARAGGSDDDDGGDDSGDGDSAGAGGGGGGGGGDSCAAASSAAAAGGGGGGGGGRAAAAADATGVGASRASARAAAAAAAKAISAAASAAGSPAARAPAKKRQRDAELRAELAELQVKYEVLETEHEALKMYVTRLKAELAAHGTNASASSSSRGGSDDGGNSDGSGDGSGDDSSE